MYQIFSVFGSWDLPKEIGDEIGIPICIFNLELHVSDIQCFWKLGST